MIKATVADWEDGMPCLFADANGNEWYTVVSDRRGTFAVQKWTEVLGGDVAGVFLWDRGSLESGEITPFEDGDTYEVHREGDMVVVGGCWQVAEWLTVPA